jgi:hypothetical protein
MNESASAGSLPVYLRSRVSGLLMSGNFSPANLGLRRNSACCSSVSDPSSRWMMYSWSMSDSPGNRGCPSTSSPMMHLDKHVHHRRPLLITP